MKRFKRSAVFLLITILLISVSACDNQSAPLPSGDPNNQAGPATENVPQEGVATSEGLEMVKLTDSYMVAGIGICEDKDIVIPSVYKGLPVTAIGSNAFVYEHITGVYIPGSVTKIGSCAFQDCHELARVTLCEGLEIIKDYAFNTCSALEEVTFPSTLTKIEWNAFFECNSLKKITFLGNTDLEGDAFDDCNALKEVYFLGTDGRKYNIGSCAFTDTGIERIAFSEGLEIIEDGAFFAVITLKEVFIPSTVTSIDNTAFACSGLEQIYYAGTPDQWGKIKCVVSEYDIYENPILTKAVIYNSEKPDF
jgi:hypothetical protein